LITTLLVFLPFFVALAGGNVDEAVRLYSDILEVSVSNENDDRETQTEDMVRVYCNRSLAFYKKGMYEEALQDACMAMEVLGGDDHPHEDRKGSKDCGLMAKVYHRKAQALIGRGDKVQGLNVYRDGLKQCGGENLRAAILLVLQNQMPDSWITEYWMDKVSRCEVAHPLSARDGILLKRVPASRKMVREEMTRSMLALLESDAVFSWECRELMVSLWENAGGLRQSCAYVRGAVYAQAGTYEQGEKDATVAVVYGGGAAAYALRSHCYEHQGDNVNAVLDILRAMEGEKNNADAEEQYASSLTRLLPRVPEHYARAVESGCGYAGLKRMIDIEQERLQPEFKKQRPKYYYYYEWMKKRIHERHPAISEGVMDKLLTLDATELDLLLQYPQAIDATVARLEHVLEEKGEKDLEEFDIPLLSWEEVEEYKKQQADGKDQKSQIESSHQHQIEAN
jgi:hypothetical protein